MTIERPRSPTTAPTRPREVQLQLSRPEKSGNGVAGAVEVGTGRFVQAPGRSRTDITHNAGGEVTLNVANAELRDVVRLILDETLHVNYVIDPTVSGQITVQTSQPVATADLPALLDTVLRVNGAALVQVGDVYKIVPINQAGTSGPVPEIHPLPDAGRPGFAILVVPVRFVSAAALVPLLTPFAPPGGSLQVDPDRNLLVLAGTRDELSTLTDLVSMFDVDWLAGMSFGLYPLDFARPAQLVSELEQIFSPSGASASNIVRFLPIGRLNAVFVMSSQPAYLDRAEAWIRRLDQPGENGEAQIYVYAVQNGRAADLAQVLSKIFNVQSSAVGPRDLLAPGLQPVSIGSSLPGKTELEDIDAAQPIAPEVLDRSTQPSRGQGGPEAQIVADTTTNSLVIRATPGAYSKIRKALEQLDILPLQVLIEATVAEVTLKDELRYGVEWFLHSGDFSATLSQAASGGVGSLFPGFSALIAGSDVRAVLNALQRVTDVNVVSSPHLLVLDNQTARLQVGDQVPITIQQATSVSDPDAPIVNSIELRDTGVILSVTPRVNAGGLVVIELRQEVSNVVKSETQTSSEQATPTISQRQISSTVAVQSGETVVLGGLIQDNRDNSVSGLPFLSRLPIIGPLFGTRSRAEGRTELLVLLTPRVIRGVAEARAITNEMRRLLRMSRPLAGR